jgi:hypothetical protein
MITAIIIAAACAFAALACYASCVAAGRADEQSERYMEEHKNELHGRSKE